MDEQNLHLLDRTLLLNTDLILEELGALLFDDKVLRLWDLAARKEVREFRGNGELVSQVVAVFASDGRVVATAGMFASTAAAIISCGDGTARKNE